MCSMGSRLVARLRCSPDWPSASAADDFEEAVKEEAVEEEAVEAEAVEAEAVEAEAVVEAVVEAEAEAREAAEKAAAAAHRGDCARAVHDMRAKGAAVYPLPRL